jgi:hypothetical protein
MRDVILVGASAGGVQTIDVDGALSVAGIASVLPILAAGDRVDTELLRRVAS